MLILPCRFSMSATRANEIMTPQGAAPSVRYLCPNYSPFACHPTFEFQSLKDSSLMCVCGLIRRCESHNSFVQPGSVTFTICCQVVDPSPIIATCRHFKLTRSSANRCLQHFSFLWLVPLTDPTITRLSASIHWILTSKSGTFATA